MKNRKAVCRGPKNQRRLRTIHQPLSEKRAPRLFGLAAQRLEWLTAFSSGTFPHVAPGAAEAESGTCFRRIRSSANAESLLKTGLGFSDWVSAKMFRTGHLAPTFADAELTPFEKFPINEYDVDDPGVILKTGR